MSLKRSFQFIIPLALISVLSMVLAQDAIVADHTVTGIHTVEKIPLSWIKKAQDSLKIGYQHTSHGSQVESALGAVETEYGSNYGWKKIIASGISGASDLGNPNRTAWITATYNFLNNPNNSSFNTIMWSWCGQVGTDSATLNSTYLLPMDSLEKSFPKIKFIYMTGHLNGGGTKNNPVYDRNQQIRKFCREQGKILFDFADIESYTPDGLDVRELMANDECLYDSDGNGSRDKNWATEYCNKNPDSCYYNGSCAHSQSLNCQLKAGALWWMFARMVGWEGFGATKVQSSPKEYVKLKSNGNLACGKNMPVSIYTIRGRLIGKCTLGEISNLKTRLNYSSALSIIRSEKGYTDIVTSTR